jgi:membrane protein DedA with SNARE-associated domain
LEVLFEFFATLFSGYTYPFVFFIIFVISVIPILTPPTWIVIVSAYSLNDQLNPILLSMIGASAAISSRLILLQLSTVGRKAINDHTKNSLDRFRKYLEKKLELYYLHSFPYLTICFLFLMD